MATPSGITRKVITGECDLLFQPKPEVITHESFIKLFIEKMKDIPEKDTQHFQHLCRSPPSGSSAFTFICTLKPPLLLTTKKTDDVAKSTLSPPKDYKFILKWNKEPFSINEKLGSDLLNFFGLKAPTVHILGADLESQLSKVAIQFKGEKRAFNPELTPSLIFMEAFEGGTLTSHLKFFLNLSKEEHVEILFKFGEVVIFDLMMGNHDRLVRLDLSNDDFLSMPPALNDGNIMLDIPLIDGERSLKDICFIDNATYPAVFTKKEQIYDEECLSGFFGSEDEFESVPETVKEKSKEEESKTSYETSEETLTQKTVDKLKKSFSHLISNRGFLQRNVTMALKICFEESFKDPAKFDDYAKNTKEYTKKLNQFLELSEKPILEGFDNAITIIKGHDKEKFKLMCDGFLAHKPLPESLPRTLNLIKSNIEFVQAM